MNLIQSFYFHLLYYFLLYAVRNRCDPAVEIGDAVVISDAFRNDDAAIVTGLDIQYNGALSCVTEAERRFGDA